MVFDDHTACKFRNGFSYLNCHLHRVDQVRRKSLQRFTCMCSTHGPDSYSVRTTSNAVTVASSISRGVTDEWLEDSRLSMVLCLDSDFARFSRIHIPFLAD